MHNGKHFFAFIFRFGKHLPVRDERNARHHQQRKREKTEKQSDEPTEDRRPLTLGQKRADKVFVAQNDVLEETFDEICAIERLRRVRRRLGQPREVSEARWLLTFARCALVLPTEGSVLVTARPFPRFEYGDKLTLQARLETPPDDVGFDYREYLARQGVVSLTLFPQIERTATA